jgi:hypothetical protein
MGNVKMYIFFALLLLLHVVAACCFTLDRTISAAFRRSLSQMAILEWPPFAATMADCLEPRGGWVEGNSGAGLPLSR